MKTTKFFPLFALIMLLALFSCKNKTATTSAGNNEEKSAVENLSKGKYAIKSGIVEYKANVINMEQTQTITFDDYGAKQVTQAKMEMMGMKINQYTLIKDGYIYSFNKEKKTGTKHPVAAEKSDIDFQNLTEEIKEKMKIKKIGEETFLGKPCVKYSIDNEKLKMKGVYWVWNGIALKMDVDMGGMKMVLETVKIEENPNIPANTFDVPSDIKFE